MACGRTGRVEAGKREIKRQLQLTDGIMKEDLYTAYHAVSENEEIVVDRDDYMYDFKGFRVLKNYNCVSENLSI